MEQQSEVQQSESTTDNNKALLWAVGIVMGLALLAAFIGTILGANNFMNGPAVYPAWVRTTWFVSDILLVLFILVHIVFFASQTEDITNDSSTMGGVVAMFLVVLLGGGALLWNRHLAWVSMLALIILVACLIADIAIILKANKSEG